ncbi:MAG: B12-binding domain-containing radical SAM protein [Candidatus Kariarchaeum pelagius]
MTHKQKQINLCWTPFGYSYSVPLSLGYLKSNLKNNNFTNVKVIDLNQDFWYRNKEELGRGLNPFEERYKTLLQNVTNWNNPQNYYEKIHSIGQIKDLVNEYCEQLLENNPSIIGFCIFNTNIWFTLEVCTALKIKQPNIKIMIGGPEATASHYNPNHKLKEMIQSGVVDVLVFGEGDITVSEVCDTILKEEYDYKSIDGVYYLGENGKVENTKWRDFIKDIDSIAIPDYSDIDFQLYQQPEIPIVLSRGCNYSCIYCGVKLYWKKASDFRKRSSQNIFEEILYLDESGYLPRGQFNFLSWKGAYVNTDVVKKAETESGKSILEELCEKIIDHYKDEPYGVPFQWGGWARVDKNLTPEVCKKMFDAGCHHLTFGFESGSPRINKEMRKGYKFREYDNEYAAEVFKNCMDAGIQTVLFLIVGYPTETKEDFEETMKFLKKYRKHIDAVYCMSTFILSKEMQEVEGKAKFHIRSAVGGGGDMAPHPIEWESAANTYEERLERLEIFREYAEKEGLTTISPRLPDQETTPNQGTTMD